MRSSEKPCPIPGAGLPPAPPPRSHGPALAPCSPGEVAPAAASRLVSAPRRGQLPAARRGGGAASLRPGRVRAGGYRGCRRAGGAPRPTALLGGGAAESQDRRRHREPRFRWLRAEASAARRCRSAGATSRPKIRTWTPSSASSRARVSACVGLGGRSGVLLPWRQEQSDSFANFEWSRVGDTGC